MRRHGIVLDRTKLEPLLLMLGPLQSDFQIKVRDFIRFIDKNSEFPKLKKEYCKQKNHKKFTLIKFRQKNVICLRSERYFGQIYYPRNSPTTKLPFPKAIAPKMITKFYLCHRLEFPLIDGTFPVPVSKAVPSI